MKRELDNANIIKAWRCTITNSQVSVDQFSLQISKSFLIPVRLATKNGPIILTALIDSGAALNLINKDHCQKIQSTYATLCAHHLHQRCQQ